MRLAALVFLVGCGSNPFLFTAEAVTDKVLNDTLEKKIKPFHSHMNKRLDTIEELVRSQQTNINFLIQSQKMSNLEFTKWKIGVEKHLAKINGHHGKVAK